VTGNRVQAKVRIWSSSQHQAFHSVFPYKLSVDPTGPTKKSSLTSVPTLRTKKNYAIAPTVIFPKKNTREKKLKKKTF
jgi:hypothetical protein